jgi:hypothetical protein
MVLQNRAALVNELYADAPGARVVAIEDRLPIENK